MRKGWKPFYLFFLIPKHIYKNKCYFGNMHNFDLVITAENSISVGMMTIVREVTYRNYVYIWCLIGNFIWVKQKRKAASKYCYKTKTKQGNQNNRHVRIMFCFNLMLVKVVYSSTNTTTTIITQVQLQICASQISGLCIPI